MTKTKSKYGVVWYTVLIGWLLFVLFGSFGGAYTFYELYLVKTGVQLNGGKQLTRGDLLDMVLISAVKQAQEENAKKQQETTK